MTQNGPNPDDLQGTAAEIVASGQSLARLENTTQMQVAVVRKRDEAAILKGALRELELYRTCAEQAIYTKPVGRDKQGRMKYVRGPSIRMAEDLANRWGNNAWAIEITGETEEGCMLVAVYLDYETNTRRARQKWVSKFYKAARGGVTKHADDRFFDTVVPAHGSKLLREVLLRSMPAGLKEEYRRKAEEVMGDLGPENIKRLVADFGELGVTPEQIKVLVNGRSADKVTGNDVATLQGTLNALRDGETTIEELFADAPQQPSADPPKGPSVNDVLNGKTQEEAPPQEEPPAPPPTPKPKAKAKPKPKPKPEPEPEPEPPTESPVDDTTRLWNAWYRAYNDADARDPALSEEQVGEAAYASMLAYQAATPDLTDAQRFAALMDGAVDVVDGKPA